VSDIQLGEIFQLFIRQAVRVSLLLRTRHTPPFGFASRVTSRTGRNIASRLHADNPLSLFPLSLSGLQKRPTGRVPILMGSHPVDGYPVRLGYPAAGWVLAATHLRYAWTHLRRVPRTPSNRLVSGPF
jgi:hypothetical protein